MPTALSLTDKIQHCLDELADTNAFLQLCQLNRGIEKESLRINQDGQLALTEHPKKLGSALTHPSITTDFSESLLELITPVFDDIDATLYELEAVHRFVYSQLDGETLWNASMPCALPDHDAIPLAQYGSSNVATMKTTYRQGLSNRYGKAMQAIAGIHYNFSLPERLWPILHAKADKHQQDLSLQDFTTESYFHLIRNFRRVSWLLIYLYGASPALDKSFVSNKTHQLEPLDDDSFYLPYATALRMGDFGYQSNAQNGLNICYNTLENYIKTLKCAITTPHPDYANKPLKNSRGEYEQLSTALLQIENEFYSSIRPKRVTHPAETPLSALKQRGVEYVEVRCIDINPYLPLGIDADQIRFIDCLLLFCLFDDSPPCDAADRARIDNNFKRVVNEGRKPDLILDQRQGAVTLIDWGTELFDAIDLIAKQLDDCHGGDNYQRVCQQQRQKLHNVELTPSAQLLNNMKQQKLSYKALALQLSKQQQTYFNAHELSVEQQQAFEAASVKSLQDQKTIEAADAVSFDTYLQNYYQQYQKI